MCIREADLQKVNHIMDHIKSNSMTTSLGRWVVRNSRSKSDNIILTVMAVSAVVTGFMAGFLE